MLMKKLFVLVISLLLFQNACIASDKQAILALIERILPGRSHEFVIRYIEPDYGKDHYRIESRNHKIILSGNNNVSLATAFSFYLQNDCHTSISWINHQVYLPAVLPFVNGDSATSPYPYRFYFNYCTFSYTMAFWNWKKWEQEIDWMALHGINLPLAIVGQEAVCQNTLRKFNYTDREIKSFICGPAFNAWWLMGNLEAWGGPVPQSWIDQQAALQKKILGRMRSLDIKPVLQGFYGMVPNSLAAKFPNAAIHDPGTWLGFKRPAMLLPTDQLFKRIAKTYYEEQFKLYGAVQYFQGDPFHEGGNTEGVDLASAGEAIYQSMHDFQKNAVWVLQSWQNNPRTEMLSRIPKGKLLITNLMAEAKPQWGGKTKYWEERKDGFSGHDWIWSEIPNFGGRTGMTAKLDSTVTDIIEALHHPIGQQSMKGVGTTPEAIGQDEVIYDIVYDLGWKSSAINLDEWLPKYIHSRYGQINDTILHAWQILRRTVYNSRYGKKDPPIESIFCARPGWNKTSASKWGSGELDYDPSELIIAWKLFASVSSQFASSDAYQFDLVNLTRQVLANYGRTIYHHMQHAYDTKNIAGFQKASSEFIDLINDQDKLLSTRKEWMVGTWLEMAKNKGRTLQEKQFYEWNARTLITTWTHERNDVNDYSCREWNGLLRDYYGARWKMFVHQVSSELSGIPEAVPDYTALEQAWTMQHTHYPASATAKVIPAVNYLLKKYDQLLTQ
jgi:alpha-N-acetylglucosaminidase